MADINQSLLDVFVQSGARPSKYRIYVNLPALGSLVGAGVGAIIDTQCKSASLPEKTIEPIDFAIDGRVVKIPGKIKYPGTWEATFYIDDLALFRKIVEDWMNTIDDSFADSSGSRSQINLFSDNTTTVKVSQLHVTNPTTSVAEYELYNAFPTGISSVELADDAVGKISEFTVTFAYSHWARV